MALPPLVVDVDRIKPLDFDGTYQSRMILDHVVTGQPDVVQINHGTVAPHAALGGATHEDDEIYYILSGHGKLQLDDQVVEVRPDQVIFIPRGVFHALDNRESDEALKILTFWRDYRSNDAYETRMRLWGKSFKTVDED